MSSFEADNLQCYYEYSNYDHPAIPEKDPAGFKRRLRAAEDAATYVPWTARPNL